MKITVMKERSVGERRVAVTPETARKFTALGASICVESGSGAAAGFTDEEYASAGASIESTLPTLLTNSAVIVKIQPPFERLADDSLLIDHLPKGAALISLLSPFAYTGEIHDLATRQVMAFSLEMIPRISRAQSMDVLSSQSNLAGYRAVIEAVATTQKIVPLMMTAAGTVKPAKALILGAGVAGLQAIATAKRLGAVVSAFDVRPVAKEQVESLGATFIEVPALKADAETAGGYAKEMDEDYKKRQEALLAEVIKDQDIVITTALIPGKPAPTLITRAMVHSMKPGSVIVDMAASAGGNCACTERGKTSITAGIIIIGHENLPSLVAQDASRLFATNLFNFVKHLVKINESGAPALVINLEDEITKSTLLTYQGKVVHPLIGERPVVSGAKKPLPSAAPAPKTVTQRKPHIKKQAAEWQES